LVVAWQVAKLVGAIDDWAAVDGRSARGGNRGASIAICLTPCTHCDVARRARTGGRTMCYIEDARGLGRLVLAVAPTDDSAVIPRTD
jgi:hypothetical protein